MQISLELGYRDIPAHIHNFKSDSLSEKKFVIICNLRRRQLNDFQQAELLHKIHGYQMEESAKKRSLVNLRIGNKVPLVSNDTIGENGRTRQNKLGKLAGLSPATYARCLKIIEDAPEDLRDRVRKGKISPYKGYKQLLSEQKRQELLVQLQKLGGGLLPFNCKLIHGDFREECTKLADNCVDLIFTVLWYAKEFLSLFDELAKVAARVLKDGSSIVTYCGQDLKLQVIDFMQSRDLTYWWEIAVIHDGPFSSFFTKNILVKWKPLLWFVKGGTPHQNGKIFDLIDSTRPNKILHDWAQSSEDARYIIEQLAKPGDTVLDPFVGSGTTGIAALNLRRHFIGIEIDRGNSAWQSFNIAKHLN